MGPAKNIFVDQAIHQTVTTLVQSLRYKTHAKKPFQLFDLNSFPQERMDQLLQEMQKPGTICVVVGGNTWRLSSGFGNLPGLKKTMAEAVRMGKLMYVSFSAGTIFAGRSVEICRDDLDIVLNEGGTKKKDGLSFFYPDIVLRPHNQKDDSKKAGRQFERNMAAGHATDDQDRPIRCTVKYLEDGEAYLCLGDKLLKLPKERARIVAPPVWRASVRSRSDPLIGAPASKARKIHKEFTGRCVTPGCKRGAHRGYDTCCRLCPGSRGQEHGDKCEKAHDENQEFTGWLGRCATPGCKRGQFRGYKTCCRHCPRSCGQKHVDECENAHGFGAR